jgi:asparagine synthase (glutamine-hydrolysing)
MCGWLFSAKSDGDLVSARESLSYRGPDATSEVIVDDLLFMHTRLAILDLDQRSNQPVSSVNGRYWLVYNGEIYNFMQLRQELIESGELSSSELPESDTLLLLNYIILKGFEYTLQKIQGMFAFLFFDRDTCEIGIARDPLGIKPLYFNFSNLKLTCGSTYKTISAYTGIKAKVSDFALYSYRKFGFVPDRVSMCPEVGLFPAGGYYYGKPQDFSPAKIVKYDLLQIFDVSQKKTNLSDINRSINNTIKKHLVSDVDVAVFLSGGVDSGALLKIASEFQSKTQAITVHFNEFTGSKSDELLHARKVASDLNVKHFHRTINIDEFSKDLQSVNQRIDRLSIDGMNVWYAAKLAQESKIKVALSGVGIDELFGGYQTQQVIMSVNRLRKIKCIIRLLSRIRPKCRIVNKLNDILKYERTFLGQYLQKRALTTDAELIDRYGYSQDILENNFRMILDLYGLEDIEKLRKARSDGVAVAYLETVFYLRSQLLLDADWASMAQSIELRTPFVDLEFFGQIIPYIQDQVGKSKANFIKACNLQTNQIRRGKKTGFGIPINYWLKNLNIKDAKSWLEYVEAYF